MPKIKPEDLDKIGEKIRRTVHLREGKARVIPCIIWIYVHLTFWEIGFVLHKKYSKLRRYFR